MFYKDNEDQLKRLLIHFQGYYDAQRPHLPIGVAVDDYIKNEIKQEHQLHEIHREFERITAENKLLLTAIKQTRGRRFYNHLLALIECSEAQWDIPMTFVTTPEGGYQSEYEFGRSIKGIYVKQKCFEDSCSGTVCVEIHPGQYLRFCFAT